MANGNDFSNVKQYNGQAQAPAKKSNVGAVMELLAKNRKAIESALPRHLTAERICRVAVNTITRTPALSQCNPATLAMAIIEASSLGLEIDGRGLAYLVPFGREVQLIYGYRGMMDLVYRSGKVISIMAEVVGKNDKFNAVLGLDQKLEHTPNLIEGRGEIIAAYAIAFMKDGSKQFVVVPKYDLDKIKDSAKSKSGPWHTWPEEMAKKTAIKRLCKLLPLSPEIQRATAIDDQADAGIAQTFCEGLEESVIDIPVMEPEPQEQVADPQETEAVQSAQAASDEHAAKAEPTPARNGKKQAQAQKSLQDVDVDSTYTFECPDNGKPVTEAKCQTCKQRKGCPAFDV